MGATTQIEKKSGTYHHGNLKQQLVEATRALVEEHGPDRFSVAQACRLAGVSTAAPYRHFETRQDMLDAVTEEGLMRMRTRLSQEAAKHPPGSVEAVAATGAAYVAFAQEEPGVFRLMFSMDSEECSPRQDEMRTIGMECFGVVLDQVAVRRGKDRHDPGVLETGMQLWTLVHGLSFLTIDGKFSVMELPVDMPKMLMSASLALLDARPSESASG